MSNNIALKSHTTRLKQRWVHISGFVQHISSATANVVCVRLQLSNRLKAELLLKANESETLSAISVHGKATQIQRSLLPCDKLMNHLKHFQNIISRIKKCLVLLQLFPCQTAPQVTSLGNSSGQGFSNLIGPIRTPDAAKKNPRTPT